MTSLQLPFVNSFASTLPDMAVPWQPAQVPAPTLVYFNPALSVELGIPLDSWHAAQAAAWWSGGPLPDGAAPVAQAYAGHQFGGFSPQLGDGRALLIGELLDQRGERRDLALKGSGRTPFSRGGDGKATLGPMLREVLMGECMHALGIPTTRALAVVATGESVYREHALPGAVLTRVAASHLRVGSFQFLAAREELDTLRTLADYAIARHAPGLEQADDRYLQLLEHVCAVQARLVAQWMGVGFVHGVMNTDNMTISGETIDYGPCAFVEAFDPRAKFSSIDHQGRYAYGNQPGIARWNLTRLAETLLPLIDGDSDRAVEKATAVLERFAGDFQAQWLAVFRRKLGLSDVLSPNTGAERADDAALIEALLGLLHAQQVDFTLGFRRLAEAVQPDSQRTAKWLDLFNDAAPAKAWLQRWHERLLGEQAENMAETAGEPAIRLRLANPAVIARNHLVEQALTAASEQRDMQPFHELLAAIQRPFDVSGDDGPFSQPAPREVAERHRTFCGT